MSMLLSHKWREIQIMGIPMEFVDKVLTDRTLNNNSAIKAFFPERSWKKNQLEHQETPDIFIQFKIPVGQQDLVDIKQSLRTMWSLLPWGSDIQVAGVTTSMVNDTTAGPDEVLNNRMLRVAEQLTSAAANVENMLKLIADVRTKLPDPPEPTPEPEQDEKDRLRNSRGVVNSFTNRPPGDLDSKTTSLPVGQHRPSGIPEGVRGSLLASGLTLQQFVGMMKRAFMEVGVTKDWLSTWDETSEEQATEDWWGHEMAAVFANVGDLDGFESPTGGKLPIEAVMRLCHKLNPNLSDAERFRLAGICESAQQPSTGSGEFVVINS